MIAALCFGSLFGLPFIAWGIILIFDRDRTWRKRLERGREESPLQRTKAWDRRQIIYGSLLILFGIAALALLSVLNYLAQSVSPPAPF